MSESPDETLSSGALCVPLASIIMLRIWCEHLDHELARSRDVLDLLEYGPLHPLFAVRPDHDLDTLAHLLQEVHRRDLTAGVWPLLPDEQGYWPSERNAESYFVHLEHLLDELDDRDARPDWVAVDLEPPIQQIDRLRHTVADWSPLLSELARENLDPTRFADSIVTFRDRLTRMRRSHTARFLSVTLPLAAHDLRDGVPFWQDLFEAPWAPVPWDRHGIMAYGSMVAGYSRGWLSSDDARAMHHRLFEHMHQAFGAGAHASLGVTGVGKLGDEPVYESAYELVRDVSAARAAGIEDIGIFCLEGLLERPDPGFWVDAIRRAPPEAPPMTLRARGARLGGAATRALLRSFFDR